jgi:NAD(P)-dependent dehydrogenase (short-subunit alcohol dehydrogenase family)
MPWHARRRWRRRWLSFGRIDVLANIAGRGSLGAVEEFAPEQLRAQMELNFFAAAELTREVLPNMRNRRAGRILNLTSIGGLISIGGFGAYCASKFPRSLERGAGR